MTAEEFKKDHRIEVELERRGVKLTGLGDQRMCRCPLHADSTASMSVNIPKQLWKCFAGCGGGSVIDLICQLDGKTVPQVLANGYTPRPVQQQPTKVSAELKFETVATYDYHDGRGELVYQVLRQHAPSKEKECGYVKTFKQRQSDERGGWIWGMDGVERVLYRLPEVLKSKTVWVTEGEKDADTLVKLGFCATCNVGGAGKWMEGYTDTLAKKNVIICGDNDEPGKKHSRQVFDYVAGKAKSVKSVQLPERFKDVTDMAHSFRDETEAKRAIASLADVAVPFIKGIGLPIYRISELEERYRRFVNRLDTQSFNLAKWLPSLKVLRLLCPGELVLVIAGTGIGKTAALSNIAIHASPMPTLFFELELPEELMYERLLALKAQMPCRQVEDAYRGEEAFGEDYLNAKFPGLHICNKSRLDPAEIESLIIRSELKIGERPRLVLVDYVQLIQGKGKSRYDRVSQVAEDLKVVAKTTQTIVVLASQVNRDATADSPEIGLNSGKDSGSLENSSGLVIGMWKDPDDSKTMHLRVLKATRGGAGTKIVCNYNTDTLAITERWQHA